MEEVQASRPLPRPLAVLAAEKNRAADEALFEALAHVAPGIQAAIVDALLRRDHPATLLKLVRSAKTLDEQVQHLLVIRIRGLHNTLRAAMASPAFEDRAAAMGLIVAAVDGSSADTLTDALRSRCHRTRELAASSLHEITHRLIEDMQSRKEHPGLPHKLNALVEALREVVARWELHFQPKALEAALWLFDRVEPAFSQKLREPQAKIVHMLNELIEGATDPKLAGAVLRALTIPELRTAATCAITRAKNSQLVRAILHEAWVLADHDVERALRWVPEGRWLDNWSLELPKLSDPQAARAVQLLAALGGSVERKMERYRAMLGAPRASIRRETLWRLVADRSPAATETLALLASRTTDELSPIAARECRRRRASPAAVPSAPPDRAPGDWIVDFFAQFERLSRSELEQRIARARADLSTTLAFLREKLLGSDPLDRARALRAVHDLELSAELDEEIYKLANDPDRVVRAAAVAMLVELPGPTTTRILRSALHDPDERVQANAIEAMDRLNIDDRLESLRPMLRSPSSRVRANAVQALLRMEIREAGATLLDMLEDATEAQRVSALWVIERMHLRSVIHRVMEMSRHDPDDRVRRRAQRVISKLRE